MLSRVHQRLAQADEELRGQGRGGVDEDHLLEAPGRPGAQIGQQKHGEPQEWGEILTIFDYDDIWFTQIGFFSWCMYSHVQVNGDSRGKLPTYINAAASEWPPIQQHGIKMVRLPKLST